MTHLNTSQTIITPAQALPQAAPGTPAPLIGAWAKTCLRLALSAPVALASGVAEVAGAIGKAAEMAYVDPFTPNRKSRK